MRHGYLQSIIRVRLVDIAPKYALPKRIADLGDHEGRSDQGACLSKRHRQTRVGLGQYPIHRDAGINDDHRCASTLSRHSRMSAVGLPDTFAIFLRKRSAAAQTSALDG